MDDLTRAELQACARTLYVSSLPPTWKEAEVRAQLEGCTGLTKVG